MPKAERQPSSIGIYLGEIPHPTPDDIGLTIALNLNRVATAADARLINGITPSDVTPLKQGDNDDSYSRMRDLISQADWGVVDMTYPQFTRRSLALAGIMVQGKKPILFLSNIRRDPEKIIPELSAIAADFPQPSRVALWESLEGQELELKSFLTDYANLRLLNKQQDRPKRIKENEEPQMPMQNQTIVSGDLVIQPFTSKVWIGGKEILNLPPQYYRLLYALGENSGRITDHKSLFRARGEVSTLSNLVDTLSRLRKLFPKHGARLIIACTGGYIMPNEPPSDTALEVIANIQRDQNRQHALEGEQELIFKSKHIELNVSQRRAVINRRVVALSNHEALLLGGLIEEKESTLTWKKLGELFDGDPNSSEFRTNVGLLVARFRRKIHRIAPNIQIVTERQLGYKLKEETVSQNKANIEKKLEIGDGLVIQLQGTGGAIDGSPVSFGYVSNKIMSFLAANPNTLFPKKDIEEEIWPNKKVHPSNVPSRCFEIRQKLGRYKAYLFTTPQGETGLFTSLDQIPQK